MTSITVKFDPRPWVCEFEAQPENGLILCHRYRTHPIAEGVETQRNYTSYRKNGIHPHTDFLCAESLKSWKAALEVMGWDS
jgi:hypothetical protein